MATVVTNWAYEPTYLESFYYGQTSPAPMYYGTGWYYGGQLTQWTLED